MHRQLVLASTSPYRKQLLERLGLLFTTCAPEVDETRLPGEAPEAMALRLSAEKARAATARFPDALIIGSDQVATVDGEIFGKPGNHTRAVEQLRKLSGRTVNFFTGLSLYDSTSEQIETVGVPTLVTFRSLTDKQIETYLSREPAYNCAGSAKSEGLGIALIASLDGSDPNALVGLPLIALCTLLQNAGVDVL